MIGIILVDYHHNTFTILDVQGWDPNHCGLSEGGASAGTVQNFVVAAIRQTISTHLTNTGINCARFSPNGPLVTDHTEMCDMYMSHVRFISLEQYLSTERPDLREHLPRRPVSATPTTPLRGVGLIEQPHCLSGLRCTTDEYCTSEDGYTGDDEYTLEDAVDALVAPVELVEGSVVDEAYRATDIGPPLVRAGDGRKPRVQEILARRSVSSFLSHPPQPFVVAQSHTVTDSLNLIL